MNVIKTLRKWRANRQVNCTSAIFSVALMFAVPGGLVVETLTQNHRMFPFNMVLFSLFVISLYFNGDFWEG